MLYMQHYRVLLRLVMAKNPQFIGAIRRGEKDFFIILVAYSPR